MKPLGLFLLLLVVWWGTTVLLMQGPHVSARDVMFALSITLFFGTLYAAPVAAYLVCVDAYSKTFPFPRNVAVCLLLVLCGFAVLFGVETFWLGRRLPTTLEGWYYYRQRLYPHFAAAAIVLFRQFRRPSNPASNSGDAASIEAGKVKENNKAL